MYNEYGDGYLEDKGPKWDVSSCSSSSNSSCQEEFISLDFIEDIPREMQEKN